MLGLRCGCGLRSGVLQQRLCVLCEVRLLRTVRGSVGSASTAEVLRAVRGSVGSDSTAEVVRAVKGAGGEWSEREVQLLSELLDCCCIGVARVVGFCTRAKTTSGFCCGCGAPLTSSVFLSEGPFTGFRLSGSTISKTHAGGVVPSSMRFRR